MRGVFAAGEQVRAARLRRGLTQEELAERTGLDVKTVRKAEGGGRVDPGTLGRLAEALGIRPDQLARPTASGAELQDRLRGLARRWLRAWDGRDGVTIGTFYHEEATLWLPGGPTIPFGGTFRGREEIVRAFETAWSTCRTEPTREGELTFLVSDNVVHVLGVKGLHLPDGEVIRLWSIQTMTIEGALIADHRVEYDTLRFVHLLGLSPPVDGEGRPGSSR